MKEYRKIKAKTWYLTYEGLIPPKSTNIDVFQWKKPSVNDYLSIYKMVGNEWGWSGRLIVPEDELEKLLSSDSTEIYNCYQKGHLIGFFEIDRSEKCQAEIVYLGLLPEFIGKGFGKDFLSCAIYVASNQNKNKVWLHTCEYDHGNALSAYLGAGFVINKQTFEEEYYSVEFLKKRNLIF